MKNYVKRLAPLLMLAGCVSPGQADLAEKGTHRAVDISGNPATIARCVEPEIQSRSGAFVTNYVPPTSDVRVFEDGAEVIAADSAQYRFWSILLKPGRAEIYSRSERWAEKLVASVVACDA